MAIMTKMRDNMPAILIGLVVMFLITIIFDWGMNYLGLRTGGNDPVIGKINDRDIKFTEFNQIVDRARENQKAQTGQDIEDDQLAMFRDQVWESYVNQILIEEEVKKLGIKVTEDEIYNIITGENPPEFLKKNFIDSLGNFNRQMYLQAIMDPRNKEALAQAEEFVKQQRLQEKLMAYLKATIVIPESEVKKRFYEQNVRADAKFVLFDVNTIKDDEVKYTEDDLRNYYKKNIDQYKVEAQRKLKYVLFRRQPSKSDSIAVFNSLKAIVEEAKRDTDFAGLIKLYTNQNYSEKAIYHGSLPYEGEVELYKHKVGDVVGPVLTYSGYSIFKIVRDSTGNDEFVHASHILIPVYGDSVSALKKANEILQQIKSGSDFAKLAKDYSQDPISASRGGDLGWFGKGMMVPPFEKAAFNAKIGEVVGPVRTDYGYHIIKVHERSKRIIIAAELNQPIKMSAQTEEELYQAAQDFAYVVHKGGDFEKEAEIMKYQVLETGWFNEKADFIPGIGMYKQLVKFAFDNKVGTVSEVFPTSQGYVVVKISEAIEEGVKSFDEVKEQIKQQVIREKKFEILKKKAEDARKKIPQGQGLDYLRTIDTTITVTQTGLFNYGQFIGGGVGRDYSFNFAAFKLKVGEVSQPVKGNRGYYLIELVSKQDFDKTQFDVQKNSIRNQIYQEKQNLVINNWVNELKKKAKIEDLRYKYYR
ncbi:MAG: peptidylprolyl isomerase [Ignavibacteria bacterium]|nr:peptidylprolyl isomerase [Ignavibacteria bacterium]